MRHKGESAEKKVVTKKRGRPPGSKKQKGRGHITIGQIEKALRASGGFTTYAAKKLNCTYQNIKKRIDGSPHLQEVQTSIHESYLDLSEHALLTQIKEGNTAAIFFHLKCKGKARGYVERPAENEQTQNPNIFNINFGKK